MEYKYRYSRKLKGFFSFLFLKGGRNMHLMLRKSLVIEGESKIFLVTKSVECSDQISC